MHPPDHHSFQATSVFLVDRIGRIQLRVRIVCRFGPLDLNKDEDEDETVEQMFCISQGTLMKVKILTSDMQKLSVKHIAPRYVESERRYAEILVRLRHPSEVPKSRKKNPSLLSFFFITFLFLGFDRFFTRFLRFLRTQKAISHLLGIAALHLSFLHFIYTY